MSIIAFLLFGVTGGGAAAFGLYVADERKLVVGLATAIPGVLAFVLTTPAWAGLGEDKTMAHAIWTSAWTAALVATAHGAAALAGTAVGRVRERRSSRASGLLAIAVVAGGALVCGMANLTALVSAFALGCDVGQYECPI